jgi:hypothetical protein
MSSAPRQAQGKLSGGYANIGIVSDRAFRVEKTGHVSFRVGNPAEDETVQVLHQSADMEMFPNLERRCYTADATVNQPELTGSGTGITDDTKNASAIQRLDQWLETYLLDLPPPPSAPVSSTDSTSITLEWTNIPQKQFAWTDGVSSPYVHEMRIEYAPTTMSFEGSVASTSNFLALKSENMTTSSTPIERLPLTLINGNTYTFTMLSGGGPIRIYTTSGTPVTEGVTISGTTLIYAVPSTATGTLRYNTDALGGGTSNFGTITLDPDPFYEFQEGQKLYFVASDTVAQSTTITVDTQVDVGLIDNFISAGSYIQPETRITDITHITTVHGTHSQLELSTATTYGNMPAGTTVLIGVKTIVGGIVHTGVTTRGMPTITSTTLRYDPSSGSIPEGPNPTLTTYTANSTIEAGRSYHFRAYGCLKYNPIQDERIPKYLYYPNPLNTTTVSPPTAPTFNSFSSQTDIQFRADWNRPSSADSTDPSSTLIISQYNADWRSTSSTRYNARPHSVSEFVPLTNGTVEAPTHKLFSSSSATPGVAGSYSIESATTYAFTVSARNSQNSTFGPSFTPEQIVLTTLPSNLTYIYGDASSSIAITNLSTWKNNITLTPSGTGNYGTISSLSGTSLTDNGNVLSEDKLLTDNADILFSKSFVPIMTDDLAGIHTQAVQTTFNGITVPRGPRLVDNTDNTVTQVKFSVQGKTNPPTQDFEGFGGIEVSNSTAQGIGDSSRLRITSYDYDLYSSSKPSPNPMTITDSSGNPLIAPGGDVDIVRTNLFRYGDINPSISTVDDASGTISVAFPPREEAYQTSVSAELRNNAGNTNMSASCSFYIDDLRSLPLNETTTGFVCDVNSNDGTPPYDYVSGIPGYKSSSIFTGLLSVSELAHYFLPQDAYNLSFSIYSGNSIVGSTGSLINVGKNASGYNIDGTSDHCYYNPPSGSAHVFSSTKGGQDGSGLLLKTDGEMVQFHLVETLASSVTSENITIKGTPKNHIGNGTQFENGFKDAHTSSTASTATANNNLRADHESLSLLTQHSTGGARSSTTSTFDVQLSSNLTAGETSFVISFSHAEQHRVFPGAVITSPSDMSGSVVSAVDVDSAASTCTISVVSSSDPSKSFALPAKNAGTSVSIRTETADNVGRHVKLPSPGTTYTDGKTVDEFPVLAHQGGVYTGTSTEAYDHQSSLLTTYTDELMIHHGKVRNADGTEGSQAYKDYSSYFFRSDFTTQLPNQLPTLTPANYASIQGNTNFRFSTFKFTNLVPTSKFFKKLVIRINNQSGFGSYDSTDPQQDLFIPRTETETGFSMVSGCWVMIYVKVVDPNNVASDHATFPNLTPSYTTTWLDAGQQIPATGLVNSVSAKNYCKKNGTGCLNATFASSLVNRQCEVFYNSGQGGVPDSNAIVYVRVGVRASQPNGGSTLPNVSFSDVTVEAIIDQTLSTAVSSHPNRQTSFRNF